MLDDDVDDGRDLSDVGSRHRRHDGSADAGLFERGDLLQRTVEGTGAAKPVVRLAQTVEGKLVLLAAKFFQARADRIVEMERIAEDHKRGVHLSEFFQQPPEIGV